MEGPLAAAAPPGGMLAELARGGAPRAYLAGAGGCGMRGLARFLLDCGWAVWGADRQPLSGEDPLVRQGLHPLAEGDPPPAVSLAARSVAVPEDDPAFAAACAAGARPLRYAELLGEITRLRPTWAVAGSHGKTTTTAWIAYGLRRVGRRPGFLVGGGVPQLGASADWGDPAEALIAESCEYDRTFLQLRPRVVALLNVDAEHPDTYPGGLPEVREAFERFLGLLPAEGLVLAGPEAPELASATAARWLRAPDLPNDWEVGLPGAHNRRNGALVAAVLAELGLEAPAIRAALRDFRGAARRLETVGRHPCGATVVSDYAHHPTELRATLAAAREAWPGRRLVVLFQPHQARRFTEYQGDFVAALDFADALLLLPVFRARDPEDLVAEVAAIREPLESRRPRPIEVLEDPAAAPEALRRSLRPDDLLLCLGAGDIDALARSLAR